MDVSLSIEDNEDSIIAGCVRNERWAQKLLYEEFYGSMLGVCMRYSNNSDHAEDMVHDGFIKVFRNIKKYKPGTSLAAWIRRIMVNTSIDYYRKQTRRRTEDIGEARSVQFDGTDAVSKCSEKEILSAIQQLSPAYRTVFNMYVIEGFAHKEIAEKLDITESTSRSNLVKARGKLKDYLIALEAQENTE